MPSPPRPLLRLAAWSGLGHPAAPLALLALLVALGLALQVSQPVNHDVGWYLVAAERLGGSARLYVDDVVEVNPPLILYLVALPVGAARLLGTDPIPTLRAFVVLLALGSAWLCGRVLVRLLGAQATALRRWVLAALLYVLVLLADRQFGQREHLILIFGLPYLLLLAARTRGLAVTRALAVAVGLGAGLALCLKPHYLLPVLLLEGRRAWSGRSWRALARPELGSAAALGLAYLAALFAFTPGYTQHLLPLALDGYWVFFRPWGSLLRADHLALALGGLAAALCLRRDARLGELAWVLWLAGLGCWAAALAQRTVWSYHYLPFQGLMLLLLGLLVLSLAGRLAPPPGSPRLPRGAWLALPLAAGLLALQPGLVRTLRDGEAWRAGRPSGPLGELVAVMDQHAAGRPVAFLTTAVHGPFPALNYSQASWASRFSCLWMLPAVLRYHARDAQVPESLTEQRAAALEQALRDAVVEDLQRHRPALIFIDTRTRKQIYGAANADMLEFFRRDPRFERIWSHYRFIGQTGRYRVARRGPGG